MNLVCLLRQFLDFLVSHFGTLGRGGFFNLVSGDIAEPGCGLFLRAVMIQSADAHYSPPLFCCSSASAIRSRVTSHPCAARVSLSRQPITGSAAGANRSGKTARL